MSIKSEINILKRKLFPWRQKKEPAKRIELNHRILVGTHHKAGTVWMHRIFVKICREFGFTLDYGESRQNKGDSDVIFAFHSEFDRSHLQTERRGVHMIRDPRDMIVSGCFYHQRSTEEWLHIKQGRFGGLTYQEKLNSFASLDDQILFEMENWGLGCIRDMLAWNYHNPAFFEVKYEDLISDYQLILFHSIFAFLGFPGQAIPQVLKISYENSLFSGRVTDTHIRSGKTGQWQKYFSGLHKIRFLDLFGEEALMNLGYESDNDWAAPDFIPSTCSLRLEELRALRHSAPTHFGQRKAA